MASPSPGPARWGEDRHGLFMGFSIAGVTQRLRYIPPGEFLMGSPQRIGRYDDEEQHPVRIAEGFWLADTPCTQALWQAVMGRTRHLKDAMRPVETVSWDDCQEFLHRLNKRVPGLSARLPSEVEWEYACRAGTPTATWAGDLESGTSLPYWSQSHGTGTTAMGGRSPYKARQRTLGACTTCWETSLSGARISIPSAPLSKRQTSLKFYMANCD